ncbi:PhoX domain-containing protein [Phanerochaete sordida]|uniref:PhoX domain-containing protein n=1 Tax=Phanerochaete sordida TaxID=48140 RepID=A0A9P3LCT1_9APHY|nr:PhoX domain-containing protein [Phanerochaete sordida]
MAPLSRQGWLILLATALVLPATAHVLSSPITTLLLSPLILLFTILAFFAFNLILAHFLDASRPQTPAPPPLAGRPLAFSTPAAWQAVLTRSQWAHKPPTSLPPLHPDSPVVSAALNEILILIVRDFVLSWYREISSSPSFPTAVSATMHSSIQRLLTRAANLDLPALVVKRIMPKVTAHIEQFRQSEVALRGAGLERRLTQSEELDILLASRYASRGGGKLHPAVDNLSSTFTKQAEENHLRGLIDKALPYILPAKEANSECVKIVVREIVACSVLYPVMDMLADPDFWNRMINQVAGEAIRQQKLISKVRNVLETQLPRSPRQAAEPALPTADRITIRTDARHFESFLRSISRCSSLLDARRLKNDVMGEIRRTRALLANHENEDWINGEKTEDIVAFLDRLYTAKRKVEKRIAALGGEPDTASLSPTTESFAGSRITLRDVLTNPTSLSYFMEFMDRRKRSLLIQFWLTVESFKNPLESVESGSDSDDDEPIRDPSLSKTLKEDILMMNELYFSGPMMDPALAIISQKNVNTIRSFAAEVEEEPPTPAAEKRVRRSVMLAQRQVERAMEEHDFEDFQRSELWFRVIGDSDLAASRGSVDQPLVRASTTVLEDARPVLRGKGRAETAPPRFPAPLGFFHVQEPSTSSVMAPPTATNPYGPMRSSPSDLELLMSPAADGGPTSSRAPLFDDPDDVKFDAALEAHSQRMEAIQAALTDIIALDQHESSEDIPDAGGSLSDSITLSPPRAGTRGILESARVDHSDDEGDADDRREDQEQQHSSFQLAGPGDLHLAYEIARLSDKIASLQTQEGMLDTLIKKAELTGDEQELKLLQKSKSSLAREIRELNFQQSQYEQQESANRLVSDRTKITIVNSAVGEENGKSVVRYLIEVQQLAADGTFASGWVVARRYNEFFNMHNKLREKYAAVRALDFPGKRLVTSLSNSFVDSRRVALEKYMQSLIAIPAVCESTELRVFLSRDSPFMAAPPPPPGSDKTAPGANFPGQRFVRTMYKSVADSIDDMFFGPSMLDVIIQRLTSQAAEFVGIVGSGVHDEDLVSQALRASSRTTSEDSLLQLPGDLKPLDGETSTSSFSSPICDLILAVFELNKKNNWLRRQAIVIILQQVFGSTIERQLRETTKAFLDEPHLLSYIDIFRSSLWENGQLKTGGPPRTAEEKLRTRDEANRKLSALMPDLGANMIGRSNARRGARRIFAVMQNRRLNQHLMYTVVDEVFAALFPEQ